MPIVEAYVAHGRAAAMVGRDGDREADLLSEVAKALMWEKAAGVVRRAGNGPVLYSYQSDGAPALTHRRWVHKLEGTSKKVRRSGGASTEYLLQKAFVLTQREIGGTEVVALFAEPRPLSHGKDTWCMYTAARDFFPTLRKLGHRGIALSHYSFDRAVFSACGRKLLQMHMERECVSSVRNPADGALLALTDWQVLTPCCNHDIQNAMTWSLSRHIESTEGLKDLFIAIASLRNAFDLLVGHLKVFLESCLELVDEADDHDESFMYWVALGVDTCVAEQLADLSLRWHNGRLRVHVADQVDVQASLVGRVSDLMMALFRFKKFSESRWCTVGDACRSLAAALSVGLDGLVRCVRADPKASDYHIHGFGKLVGPSRTYCVIACLACTVTDTLLLELLEDDRVGARLEELEATVAGELEWLASIKHSTWARLAALAGDGYSPRVLRSDVLESASLASSFVHRAVFKPARRCPWSLARGSISENLEVLCNQDVVPKDPLAQKVQKLLRSGYNRHLIERGLRLLNEVHWSTAVVEQGHGSTAVVHRYHPMYSPERLATRAFLHMFAKLLGQPEMHTSAADRHMAALKQLLAKVPRRVHGRQMFLKAALLAAREGLPAGVALPRARAQAIMEQHAALYRALPPARRQQYEHEARVRADEREQDIEDQRAYLASQVMLEKRRLASVDVEARAKLRISNCRLSELDRVELEKGWEVGISAARLKDLRAAAHLAPTQPPENEQRALSRHPVTVDAWASGQAPSWCAHVCRNRAAFSSAALTFTRRGEVRVYMLLYAKQSPMQAMFAPLYLTDEILPASAASSIEDGLRVVSERWDWTFEVEWGEYVAEGEIEHGDDTEVAVLLGLVFTAGKTVASHGELIPLEEFVRGLPQPRPSAAGHGQGYRAGASAESATDELRRKFPWLKKHFVNDEDTPAEASDDGHAARRPDAADPLSDDEVDAAFEALDAKRREWDANELLPSADFRTSIRGGAWTKANRGVSFDCISGSASSAALKTWCRRYSLQSSVSFAYAKYGEEVASALALGWCHKMQVLRDMWVGSGVDRYELMPNDGADQAEHEVFAAVAGTLAPHDPASARVATIRGLAPSRARW